MEKHPKQGTILYKILQLLCIGVFMFSCAHLKEVKQAYSDEDYERTVRLCRIAIQ
jgi:hypothetical protein